VKKLIVQSDDLGMCGAVNDGIRKAFTEGILTQATAMAPCPAFDDGAAMAVELGIPCGVHTTFTSEWDHVRWGPVTDGGSLVGEDGTLRRTVEAAKQAIDTDEAVAEAVAQAERVTASGIVPIHCDCHMGLVSVPAYREVCDRFGLRFLYPVFDDSFRFDSITHISGHLEGKLEYVVGLLDGLDEGVHLVISHCGVGGEELAGLTSRENENFPWAEQMRTSDLEVLTSPEVREAVERNGIELASVDEL